MSVPVDYTKWKNLYPFMLSREYESLNKTYFNKFGEHLDFTMFPEDTIYEKLEADVRAAIANNTEIISYYCPSCHNHEGGVVYTDDSPCKLCGFPAYG